MSRDSITPFDVQSASHPWCWEEHEIIYFTKLRPSSSSGAAKVVVLKHPHSLYLLTFNEDLRGSILVQNQDNNLKLKSISYPGKKNTISKYYSSLFFDEVT